MDWSNERYVRLYTRDSADMLAVGWEGRLVLYELIRKVDRAGILDHGGDLEIVPEMLRVPQDVFLTGFAKLMKREVVLVTDRAIVLPGFIEAQEAPQSDRLRQQESRHRRRDRAVAESRNVTSGHEAGPDVTSGHEGSRRDTPCHSKPNQPDPANPDLDTSPPARRSAPIPPEAEQLADELRDLLVAEKPDHALAAEASWRSTRPAWAKQMATLLRAGRDAAKASDLLAWVFGDQGGAEFRFRVDSPKALKAKWDRVETAMAQRGRALQRRPLAVVRDAGAELMGLALQLEAEGK